jgi:uncharacterized surface protein with fasciclin (FAS1) repeats
LALALAAPPSRAADIVDTAVGAGNFQTLATALGAAGLVETLKGPGPFTVFAPTDEAFAKLPTGTVESLLKPENKGTLTGILTYHVVPGKVQAAQVVTLSSAKTVNGQRVDIQVVDGSVLIDGATVTTTDIICDNGVIHVIDSVLLPVDQTIPEVATSAGKFSTLLAAVGAAGLAETLGSEGPFTVFAPTDEAFGSLPAGTIASLLEPANRTKLTDILKYHVVAGRVDSEAALKAGSAATLLGPQIKITKSEAGAMINNARLVTADVDASNGVIHVIDRVLLPTAGNSVASAKSPAASGRQMIETAVKEGAALFNSGQHGACANLYMKTCEQLVELEMSAQAKASMRSAMQTARGQHDMSSRAWTLRRAMESAYGQF